MNNGEKPKVVAIIGPTASGKTALSIKLAKEFDGEIISADSRQVYRGMDIGTGKVTLEEMEGITHHLLDKADPVEVYTGTDFKRDAMEALEDITKRNHLPIIAGGTFFYLELLRGSMQAAPVAPNPAFRKTLEPYSNAELLAMLREKDPRRADTVDPNNRRRLERALEIIDTLGVVPPVERTESDYDWLILGIRTQRDSLREKFSQRLADWLKNGLTKEVSALREQLTKERFKELGFEYTLTADYIDENITEEELFEKFVQKNWQYAKQQLTWLKRYPEIHWVESKDLPAVFALTKEFLNHNPS